jgi:hypothetical protein
MWLPRSATNKAQYLHPIPLAESAGFKILAIQNLQIQFDGDAIGADLQLVQQRCNRLPIADSARFTIHMNDHCAPQFIQIIL